MKSIFSMLGILAAAHTMLAQIRPFKWQGEMCSYSATYDSKRHNEKQLRNTARLLTFGNFELTYFPMVFKHEDIRLLDVAKIDHEYRTKIAELKALDLVPGPYWENVRQKRIKEMDQSYRLRRTQTLAYRDPRVLREYAGAPSCKLRYTEPLIAGGESLYKIWLDVNKESRKENADPDRVRRDFESHMASPDRDKFAFVEVMGFGWGNCANALVEYDEAWREGTYLTQFKKLFIRVRESCEEP